MALPQGYTSLNGSEHGHAKSHKMLSSTAAGDPVTVTLILRRGGSAAIPELKDLPAHAPQLRSLSRKDFEARFGAGADDLARVAEFAAAHGLEVIESNAARRSVVLRGSATAINAAFGVTLQNYDSPRGKYRGHEGPASVPQALAQIVQTVSGLDNRPVPAQHYATARRHPSTVSEDPAQTHPLTPQTVAQLYNFPAGNGAGQTIGIYEMQTSEGSAGYTAQDLTATMNAFGGGLTVPKPIDVSIDGVTNTGVSDGETVLDITVSSAIAQAAGIAVYFTGGTTQSIIHALQRMIHPGTGDPVPTILSISYGWGPDDESAQSFSGQEYTAIDQLFQDAATLGITVLVSTGDSGAYLGTKGLAQASFPATEPWVVACGGTTIGNVDGTSFTEYVWNDSWQGGAGATGGGISARYPVPPYQADAHLPVRNGTKAAGRGIPDMSGNASVNSGYPVYLGGQSTGATGGTSAVAPLFAGLIARINANLGYSVGFINPTLYSLAGTAFRNVVGPPGPANNSFDGTTGYPATAGWNACTGLGSVDGIALQAGLQAAHTGGGGGTPATSPEKGGSPQAGAKSTSRAA